MLLLLTDRVSMNAENVNRFLGLFFMSARIGAFPFSAGFLKNSPP
jgi:hypothetical protein